MLGKLEITSPHPLVYSLPMESISLGGGAGDQIQIPGLPPDLVRFSWDGSLATWRLALASGAAQEGIVNGVLFGANRRPPLLDGYHLRVGNFSAVFHRELAMPRVRNAETAEIVLGRTPLVFGRGASGAEEGEEKVELDAQDNRVSKRHAVLAPVGGEYFLTDEGRFLPTVLNENAFERQRLVYGDRFRVGDYLFEYTGSTVRRVDQIRTGEVLARDIRFVVQARPKPFRNGLVQALAGVSGINWLRSKLAPEKRTILQGITVAIKPGEFVGVLGGSGQGKSTLLNALCGINPATSGAVLINGLPLTDRRRMRQLGIGYVPQDDIVHRELSVEQAISYSARLRLKLARAETAALVDGVIRRMGLEEHRAKRVSQLSGGQRKRVSIAIELLAKPTILFLDEPSSGLDPATEEELMNLLQKLAKTGLTVVCTTHVLQLAHLFDRLLIIHGGRCLFSGTADEARRLFLEREQTREITATQTSIRGATSLAPLQRIYSILASDRKSAEQWEAEFLQSEVSHGHREALKQVELNATRPAALPEMGRRSGVGYVRTLWLLMARQARILLADPLNVLFLVAQALMIGFLVGWVTEDVSLRLFLGMIATMWFGCSNGAQQIVSELPIFRRERVCGQGINVYLHSKLLFLSIITMVQSMALLATIQGTALFAHPPLTPRHELWDQTLEKRFPVPLELSADEEMAAMGAVGADGRTDTPPVVPPVKTEAAKRPSDFLLGALVNTAHFFDLQKNLLDSAAGEVDGVKRSAIALPQVLLNSLGLKLLSLLLAAFTGVVLGLTISAVVQSATQAAMWVPLILIPQILFGGYVVHIPEMSRPVRIFSGILPSCAAQQIMDVGTLYGQDTPRMSNSTKIAVFIDTTEEKEKLKWKESLTGRELNTSWDRKSLFNSAWQNLVIDHDRAGQWKPARETSGREPNSVPMRWDVNYAQNRRYLNLAPFHYNAQVLAVWAAACYAVIVIFLAARQTGK